MVSLLESSAGADDLKRHRPAKPSHAPLRAPQRHDQGRPKGRAHPQARLRRGRAPAGLAEGTGEFRHRRRSPRRGDIVRRARRRRARATASWARKAAGAKAPTTTHTWIVDPLDGTSNFLHGIPHFAISIGLEREGTIVAGLVYNPISDELFTAERGKGAFLNNQRLRVAARKRLGDAVVACGLPHLGRGDLALGNRELAAVQPKVAGLRRFGAASLDLAWVAAGRFDAYWERQLSPWDIAGGPHPGARGRRLCHRPRAGDTPWISGDVDRRQRGDAPRASARCSARRRNPEPRRFLVAAADDPAAAAMAGQGTPIAAAAAQPAVTPPT